MGLTGQLEAGGELNSRAGESPSFLTPVQGPPSFPALRRGWGLRSAHFRVVTHTVSTEVGVQATGLGLGPLGSPDCQFNTRSLLCLGVDVDTAIKIEVLAPFLQRTLAEVNQLPLLTAGGTEQQHNFYRAQLKWKKPFF